MGFYIAIPADWPIGQVQFFLVETPTLWLLFDYVTEIVGCQCIVGCAGRINQMNELNLLVETPLEATIEKMPPISECLFSIFRQKSAN